ncbi:MAG: hypothetical protein IJX95_05475, partial [Lachnospiraceae bacterium]|nr:hypothetical protein [Lachnospiraceae bacterium]
MKGNLIRKLVVFYLLIACVLFIFVNTVLARLAEKKIVEQQEQAMYTQTGIILNGYVERYYGG